MGSLGTSDVLLALIDVEPPGVGGLELIERLSSVGVRARADDLLVALLRLEGIGLVEVDRADGMRFAPSPAGRQRSLELVGGEAVPVVLVMADLADFTGVTSAHGDEIARWASAALARVATAQLEAAGGTLVKMLGDGFLGWLPPTADPLPTLRAIAAACTLPSGEQWPLRAACHRGSPIQFRGDVFGADVNLVARLCATAQPDELLCSMPVGPGLESVALRGLAEPVAIRREALR